MNNLIFWILHFFVFLELSYSRVINFRYHLVDIKVKSWNELKNRDIIIQRYDFSCGSASLATILRFFYGKQVTESSIIKRVLGNHIDVNKSKDTASITLSFYDLSKVSEEMGFESVALEVNIKDLKKIKIPVIAHVKIHGIDHFTVLKKIVNGNVYLADPSFGNVEMKLERFEYMFIYDEGKKTGRVLAVLPRESLQTQVQRQESFLDVLNVTEMVKEIILSKMFR